MYENEYGHSDAPAVRGVQFSPIDSGGMDNLSASPGSIDLLKDVPLSVTAELGRSRMLVKDILRLGVGSVIELDKETGEALDLMVNNKMIARGEVVEIDGNFGIRVTEIPGR
jgi:flagellar motor switch protein FliN/FliY